MQAPSQELQIPAHCHRPATARRVQVVETRINQVMHSRPRTCASHIKAVDAMLVGALLYL